MYKDDKNKTFRNIFCVTFLAHVYHENLIISKTQTCRMQWVMDFNSDLLQAKIN